MVIFMDIILPLTRRAIVTLLLLHTLRWRFPYQSAEL